MVRGKRKEGWAAEISTKTHTIISDMPASAGGHDEGMNPHEIIKAGLVACTIVTCQMYADRKKWNLVSTDVKVKILSETEEGAVFHREITFTGDLTHEQRERLLEIANKTPVFKLLTRPISIETVMNEPK